MTAGPRAGGLRTFLDDIATRNGEATFLKYRGRSWSHADMARITDGGAAAFHRLGIRRGDRVAMLLPNGPDPIFAWLSLAKLGAVTAPLHPRLTRTEIDRMTTLLDPKAIVHDPALPTDAPGALGTSSHGLVVARGAPLDAILSCRDALSGADAPQPDDPVDILMTSGTTGLPKGVVQTHRTYVLTGEAFAHWLELGRDDCLFTCLPFSHINARAYSTMGALAAGASLAVEERFSASRFWDWVAAAGSTQINAIGAMLHILLQAPPSAADRGHRVRLVYSAPALGETEHLAFERRFGVRLVIGYGLTESTFGFIHPLRGERRLNTMGRPRCHPDPAFGNEVKLIDASGRDSDEGEIWLRNAALFAGYFRDEQATRETLMDGWLRTGDVARRDEGDWYTFVARRKEIIRRRGENIAPAEVEAVLMTCPGVLEAAVVGVPSAMGEEDVAAFVVARPGAGLTAEALRVHAAAALAPFKVPAIWRFLDTLPRTSTERVAKHLLLARLKPD